MQELNNGVKKNIAPEILQIPRKEHNKKETITHFLANYQIQKPYVVHVQVYLDVVLGAVHHGHSDRAARLRAVGHREGNRHGGVLVGGRVAQVVNDLLLFFIFLGGERRKG